jgi:hypothetical protein
MSRRKCNKINPKLPKYAKIGDQYVYIGNFNIDSDKIIVSDPSYKIKDKCSKSILKKVANGKWYSVIHKYLMNDRDDRNALLYAINNNFMNKKDFPLLHKSNMKWEKKSNVGVDTALMVIADYQHFRNDDDVKKKWFIKCDCGKMHSGNAWYNMANATTYNNNVAGVFTGGTISMTGYGDGSCKLFVLKNNGIIVAIKVIFIDD